MGISRWGRKGKVGFGGRNVIFLFFCRIKFFFHIKMKKNQLKSQRLKVMLNVNGNLIFCLFCLFLEKLVLAPIAQWKSASGSKIFRCGLLFTQSGWRRGTLSLVHILQMTTLELVTAILWERGRHLHQIKLYKTL